MDAVDKDRELSLREIENTEDRVSWREAIGWDAF